MRAAGASGMLCGIDLDRRALRTGRACCGAVGVIRERGCFGGSLLGGRRSLLALPARLGELLYCLVGQVWVRRQPTRELGGLP